MRAGTTRKNRFLASLVSLLLILAAPLSAVQAATSAMAVVKSAVNQALKIIADPKYKSAPEAERAELLKVLDADFDFKAMAHSSLGTQWKQLNEDQRKRFEVAFQNFMEARYVKIIESYSGQKIDFVKESSIGPDLSEVHTSVNSPMLQSPLDFNYQLRQENGEWKVYDLVIAGISEVASYRNDFVKQLNRGGFDALMKKLANPD
ncbi:MAG TPA: ABC transporter substrate-binding protein [Candidatus Binataceae bacterium]|nr:ABC transporter substrate-binding protein [Candidatus Binataceae bacterium]